MIPGSNPRAQLIGAIAQASGEAFEELLARHHRDARGRGIARVRKVSQLVKILRALGRGQFVVVFTGENGCDWKGSLRGGRAITAESKSIAGPRLQRSMFEQHQIDDLDEAARFGELALALVQLRIDGRPRRFAVEWERMPWKASGVGYGVGLEELAPWEIREGECYLERWAR